MTSLRVKTISIAFWIGLGIIFLQGAKFLFTTHKPISAETFPLTGEFDAITYNIAGLPEIVSQSKPSINTSLIGKSLNRFSLALVQEDFWYNQDLMEHADFPYENDPSMRKSVGDGLGQLSKIPLGSTYHESWSDCYGVYDAYNDCLTPKGFSFSRMRLTPDVEVHVYNLHLDAGDSAGDSRARGNQLRQLLSYVKKHSEGYPVIIGGDFNFHFENTPLGNDAIRSKDLTGYLEFLKEANLTDSCYATQCSEERLDRILYRSNNRITLSAKNWELAQGFKDKFGEALSDHEPVSVKFGYQINLTPEDMKPTLASFTKE